MLQRLSNTSTLNRSEEVSRTVCNVPAAIPACKGTAKQPVSSCCGARAASWCFLQNLCSFTITAHGPLYLLVEVAEVLFVLAAPPTSKKPKPTYMNLLSMLYTIYITNKSTCRGITGLQGCFVQRSHFRGNQATWDSLAKGYGVS